jgi:orotidine-5'-phosphate decarboxylase
MSGFIQQLAQAWATNDSLVCVGLDPEIERLPASIAAEPSPIFQFNKAIIDATADLVCAYKPQFAHYAAYEAEDQLERTIEYIHRAYPAIPVILDSKRGDVGNTAERYALEAFERYAADAVTVNPYLGGDSLKPFLQYESKGVIILCRTSNPGARDVQDLQVGSRRLYHLIAELVAQRWNTRGNCMMVVGATYPRELAEIREIAGDIPFLVPGVGAQGGDVVQVVQNGCTRNGTGLVISSSRAILYSSSGPDFATAARKAASALRDQINASRRARA